MSDPLLDLTGSTVLVTGAHGGIGAAIVKVLVSRGAHCVACDRDNIPRDFDTSPGGTTAIDAELDSAMGCERLFVELDERGLDVDRLVNCAGIYPRSEFLALAPAMIERTFAINTFAPLHLSRMVASRLIARRQPGRIVNVASDAWFKGPIRGAHYAASKAALVAMSRSLARTLGPHGITVNSVSPGMTRTRQPGLDDVQFAQEGARLPLGRVAEPEDIANAVLFLLTSMSGYVNGHDLVINGGHAPR